MRGIISLPGSGNLWAGNVTWAVAVERSRVNPAEGQYRRTSETSHSAHDVQPDSQTRAFPANVSGTIDLPRSLINVYFLRDQKLSS